MYQAVQTCSVSTLADLIDVANIGLPLFDSRNARGSVIEETSHISKDALLHAWDELANHTGDTDSEDDGVADDEDEDDNNDKGKDRDENGGENNEKGSTKERGSEEGSNKGGGDEDGSIKGSSDNDGSIEGSGDDGKV